MSKSGRELNGPVKFIHQFIDFPRQSVSYYNPKLRQLQNVTGCLPAMGYRCDELKELRLTFSFMNFNFTALLLEQPTAQALLISLKEQPQTIHFGIRFEISLLSQHLKMLHVMALNRSL